VIHKLRLAATPALLLLCLLLGGASAAGIWANMALQLIACGFLFWAVIAQRSAAMPTPGRQLLVLAGLMIALIAVQLIPLPPSVWTALPGRQQVAEGFRMLDQPLPWLPISLSPARTISSGLWLLPALAVLLGILRLGAFRASWCAWVLAIVTITSVGLGALQMVGGEQSPWYIYDITNYGVTVGFFSNANHMATLLVATVPFLAALYVNARARGRSVQRNSGMFVVLAGTLIIVFVGLAANRSVAGMGLSVPVLAGSLLMILSRRRRLPGWSAALIALLLAASVVAAFSAPFGSGLGGQEAAASTETRRTSFTRTTQAARDFLPLGSGVGSYYEVYRTYEPPETIGRFYMNHVHGDYIEVALETGIPGLVLVVLFLLWWARRVIATWRSQEPDYFARAATIASAAILAHSLVDYPLRTAAISAVFAMCCALMAEPRAKAQRKRRNEDEDAKPAPRHLSAD
jgi:O-antigen ligase